MSGSQDSHETRIRVYEKLGRITGSLASPARLKILQLLTQSPRSVEELSRASGESIANTSQHLQRMAREGLVQASRQGVSRIYRLSSPRVIALWEILQDLAHELAPDLDQAEDRLTDAALRSLEPLDEVLEKVHAKKAILVDVRDESEACSTPVPGARVIPLEHLREAIGTLPRRKPIFVFCRGRYCPLATEAVKLLRQAGLTAFRLRESPYRISCSMSQEAS